MSNGITNVLDAINSLAGALAAVSSASAQRIEILELDRDQAATERDELKARVWDALGWDVDESAGLHSSADAGRAIDNWRDRAESNRTAAAQVGEMYNALADWLQMPGSPGHAAIWAECRRRLTGPITAADLGRPADIASPAENQTAAKVYQAFRRRLADAVGIDPGGVYTNNDLIRLVRAAVTGDPAEPEPDQRYPSFKSAVIDALEIHPEVFYTDQQVLDQIREIDRAAQAVRLEAKGWEIFRRDVTAALGLDPAAAYAREALVTKIRKLAGTGQAQRIPVQRTEGPQDGRGAQTGPAGPMGAAEAPGGPGAEGADQDPGEAIRAKVLELITLVQGLGATARLSTAAEPGPDGLAVYSVKVSFVAGQPAEAPDLDESEDLDPQNGMDPADRFAPFRVQVCTGLAMNPGTASNQDIMDALDVYLNG